MVKETNLQKSLQTLDKNNKQYNELVKLWKDKYDKLIQNKKGGFCGKKTFSNILAKPLTGILGKNWAGYCGSSFGEEQKWCLSDNFYICKECIDASI